MHSTAQEMDLSIGSAYAKLKFHHSSPVDTDDDEKFQFWESPNFKIGLVAPIGKDAWHLRTELGFLTVNTFFSISYSYDEGFGEQRTSTSTYLTSQKIYLSVAPEYRVTYNYLSFKFNGGLLLSSDISNTMSSRNTALLPKSSPTGVVLGTGMRFMKNKIGVDFSLSYVKIGKSVLQNNYHPEVSYTLITTSFGVVYAL
jgi:hypothetical protein